MKKFCLLVVIALTGCGVHVGGDGSNSGNGGSLIGPDAPGAKFFSTSTSGRNYRPLIAIIPESTEGKVAIDSINMGCDPSDTLLYEANSGADKFPVSSDNDFEQGIGGGCQIKNFYSVDSQGNLTLTSQYYYSQTGDPSTIPYVLTQISKSDWQSKLLSLGLEASVNNDSRFSANSWNNWCSISLGQTCDLIIANSKAGK